MSCTCEWNCPTSCPQPSCPARSPYKCNLSIAGIMADAQNPEQPIAPTPFFFTAFDCSNANGIRFPQEFAPVDCNSSGLFDSANSINCMPIVTLSSLGKTLSEIVYSDVSQYIINLKDMNTNMQAKFNSDFLVESFYVPSTHAVLFWETGVSSGSPAASFSNNYINSNLCIGNFANGKSWFTGSTYNFDQIVVVELNDFLDDVIDSCLNNNPIFVKGDEALTVWSPQTVECDRLISNLCSNRNAQSTSYPNLCACFDQQADLDAIYGEAAAVSVVCFGVGTTRAKDCFTLSQNPVGESKAYVTNDMEQGRCQLAACNRLIEDNPSLNKKSNTGVTGEYVCAGKLFELPSKSGSNVTPPSTVTTVKKSIPLWVFIFVGITGAVVIAYLISLAFFRRSIQVKTISTKAVPRLVNAVQQFFTFSG